jgi:hypothetical protein
MADGYATEGDDQETAGDGEYATVGQIRQMLARPGAMQNALARVAPRAPARPPLNFPMRPGGGGMTEAQVRSIVRAELERRAPYGDIPPKPNQDEAMFPMGLGSIALTSANPLDALQAQPQRAFRGERLVLSVFRTAGALGIPVVIREFTVGDYKQLVGGGSLPVEVFASDAFGVRLMLDGSVPGVLYAVTCQALAPIPPGDQIIIAGAVIGRAGEASGR